MCRITISRSLLPTVTGRRVYVVFLMCLSMTVGASAQVTFINLYNFTGAPSVSQPQASLIQGTDGNFYGVSDGGAYNYGTVFKITPTGVLTILHNFCAQSGCPDGSDPNGPLLLAPDGNFYGTTGRSGAGPTIYKITPNGNLTTLFTFPFATAPNGGLVVGSDAYLYGTTRGGPNDPGTVFKISPAGTFSTVYNFCSLDNCADGANPQAGLVIANDGNLYGTTYGGGIGDGTIFEISPQGTFKTIYGAFCRWCATGANPATALTQNSDGNFYGTTSFAGRSRGTVFEITPSGTMIFNALVTNDPNSPLLLSAGRIFGTAVYGDNDGFGSIFTTDPTRRVTTLYSFQGGDGEAPSGLMQGTNGVFYGTTVLGGPYGGTFYSLSVGLPPFVAFVQAWGKVGQTRGILGQGFTGTAAVSFNGIPASFTVISDTYLVATVPAGATTGPVTVATPNGTLTSNVRFRIRP